MELQFEKHDLTCMFQAMRGVKEQELTQELRLTESMPDVGRVIGGWGQVILRGKEWLGSQMGAAGGVMAWILYAPEDGTQPRMVNAWLPFQMKWEAADPEREGPMRIQPKLRFVDGRNLSARKILVRAGIGCLAEGWCQRRTEICGPGEMPEDVQLLRRSYPLRLPREAGEKTFQIEETLDMGGQPVSELLAYSMEPEINEERVSGDKAVMRGVARLHLLYRCPEGRLRTKDFELPFSQLAELEKGYESDALLDAMMAVTGLELEMTEENLALKASLVAQYLIADHTLVELTEDAYSSRREVGLRQEELRLPVVLDETRERVSAQAVFPDTTLEPLDAAFWPGFPAVSRNGDRAEVELPGRFQLLGRDADGNLRTVSGQWTGRTELGVDASSPVDAMLQPLGAPQIITTPSGLELRSDTQVRMTTQSRQGLPMITGLELGQLRAPDRQRPSLILCRAGERRLWDIAKASGSSVAAIQETNCLEDEPENSRMLLIPVQ